MVRVLKIYLTLLTTIIFSAFANCQSKSHESINWVFGNESGLSFNGNNLAPSFFKTNFHSIEGTTCVSDSLGNLLFYSNGEKLIFQNGKTIKLKGNNSSTQSSLIIPINNENLTYALFTLDDRNDRALYYHIVDLKINDTIPVPLGQNKLQTFMSEKLSAVAHQNNEDYWIITHKINSPHYYSYLLKKNLTLDVKISNTGNVETFAKLGRGQFKFSASGRFAGATLTHQNIIDIFQFNNSTGELKKLFSIYNHTHPYGIEFSPDESKLYVSDRQGVYQYTLESGTISEILKSKKVISNDDSYLYGNLQLAPNKKIYVALFKSNFLDVIENPNSGNAKYIRNGTQLLQGESLFGLPNFPANYFLDTNNLKNFQIEISQEIIESETYFPSAFTPNGDNLNDCYSIVNEKKITSFSLDIINGYGQIIYTTNNSNFCWDGKPTFDTNVSPTGVYLFKIHIIYSNGEELSKNIPVLLFQ